MIEAYKIGVTLTLKGDASQKLAQFVQTSKRAAEAVEKLNKQMRPLYDSFSKLDDYLRRINPRMDRLAYAFGDSSKSLSSLNRTFTGFNEKMGSAIGKTESLIVKTDKLKRELVELGEASTTSGAGLNALAGLSVSRLGTLKPGRNRGNSNGFGHMHYKGAHLGGLGFVPTSMGLGLSFAGGYAIHAGYEASKTYQQIMSQILLQNIPGANENEINSFVNSNNIYGVSQTDLLQKFQDALVITKNTKEAEALTPFLSQIGFANKAIYEGTNQALNDNQYKAMVKSAELLTGSMDPSVLIPVIDEMVKLGSASSGQVKPDQILQLLTRSRGFLKNADPGILYQLEPLIQEVGSGSKVGTGVYTFFAHMLAGRVTHAAAKQLEKYGIVDPSDAEYDKTNRFLRFKPGSLKHADLMKKNFIDWYDNFFLKQLAVHGVTSIDDIEKVNSTIFTNTDLFLVNLLAQQQAKIDAMAKANVRAAGAKQLVSQAKNSTPGAYEALLAAEANLAKEFGNLTNPAVVGGMKFLTEFLNQTTNALKGLEIIGGAMSKGKSFLGDILTTPTITLLKDAYHKSHPANTIPPPSKAQPVQVTTNINLDGKAIAEIVSQHQGYQMNRMQQNGVNYPDANMTKPWLGWNGS